MNYFGSGRQPATPSQGIGACMGLALGALAAREPMSKEARGLHDTLKRLEGGRWSVEKVAGISVHLSGFLLPTGATLQKRHLEITFALRTVMACEQAAFAALSGDDVRAWRAIASAALSAGTGLAAALQGARRTAGAKKSHSEDLAAKAQAFQWLGNNSARFTSMIEMARALEREVGYPERTRYAWVRQWCKAAK